MAELKDKISLSHIKVITKNEVANPFMGLRMGGVMGAGLWEVLHKLRAFLGEERYADLRNQL